MKERLRKTITAAAVVGMMVGFVPDGTVARVDPQVIPPVIVQAGSSSPPIPNTHFIRERIAPLENERGYVVYPGWIERHINGPFLQVDGGHRNWLTQGIFNNPIVTEVTKDFFAHITALHKKGERAKLGDLLEFTIRDAHSKLLNIDKNKIDPTVKDNLSLEAVHIATYAMAGGMITWLNEDQLKRLGVSIAPHPDVNSFFWGADALGTNTFPKLFGFPDDKRDKDLSLRAKEPIWGGADRSVHASQHMLVVFSYLYSHHFNLGIDNRIPVELEILLLPPELLGGVENRARALSELASRAYEAKTTPGSIIEWLKNPDEMITEGYRDPMIDADLKASNLGAEIGIALWKIMKDEGSIHGLLADLNHERFSQYGTSASLNFSNGLRVPLGKT